MMTINKTTTQTQYDDLFIRSFIGDKGILPKSGQLNYSPDIIPMIINPVNVPQELITDQNWDKVFSQEIEMDVPNYIYIRGYNLLGENREGQIYLYYMLTSLLNWPKYWSKNALKTASGKGFALVKAGANNRFVTDDPFLWVPPLPSKDSYSLIARLVTQEHSNPIPQDRVSDFNQYIANHANVGWRILSTKASPSPVLTKTVDFSMGSEGENVLFILHCKNTPVGSAVSFSCGAPGPAPTIIVRKEPVTDERFFDVGMTSVVPAQFVGQIALTWYSQGKEPLPGMSIEFVAILPISSNHPYFNKAKTLQKLDIPTSMMNQDDTLCGKRGIRMGSQTLIASEAVEKNLDGEIDGEVLFQNVSWPGSIFGFTSGTREVSLSWSKEQEIMTETVTLRDRPQEEAVETVVKFNTGKNAGDFKFLLETHDIPWGCEIALDGGTREHPIKMNKVKVTDPKSFQVGIEVNLPANFHTTIHNLLFPNGHKITDSASIELVASLQKESKQLIGRVTTRR